MDISFRRMNEQAQERSDTIMEQLKAAEGRDRGTKRTCQMEWVQRCNNIQQPEQKKLFYEMIYS